MSGEHEGHRARVKNHFRAAGLDSFEPHNVLELLLFYSIPRGDTNLTAHRLMERFGSLSGVFEAPVEDLCEVKGVGENTAILISMIPQLARRYFNEKAEAKNVTSSVMDVGEYVLPRFVGLTEERLLLVSIDNRGKIIGCNVVADGAVDSVSVSPRKVVETALRAKATRAVLAHNHPQGFAAPSGDDISMTGALRNALSVVGIRLEDHLIVAQDDYVSMRESGVFI